jgi:[acyl-carrier-protein] S-malonyltransferase
MKTALLFAGQGAQHVGMAKDLYDGFPLAKELFDMADDILGAPLSKICFEGPEEVLKKTENTQPAILLHSYICYKLLESKGITADTFGGFSLGEYSALTAAGVIDIKDALQLVRKRGLIIEDAVPAGQGGMAAILGLEDSQVEEICEKVDGIVVPANYNCPGQLVISGAKDAVEKACDIADNEYDAKRTVILNVSGPFHSPFLNDASLELRKVLDDVDFKPQGSNKVLSNVTADFHNDSEIKQRLQDQLYSPVRWRKSIEMLIEKGYDTFIELGPGKVLTGFMRGIDRKQTAVNINSIESLDKALEKINS